MEKSFRQKVMNTALAILTGTAAVPAKAQSPERFKSSPVYTGTERAGEISFPRMEVRPLTLLDMLNVRDENVERLDKNIADAKAKIPKAIDKVRFQDVQDELRDAYEQSQIAISPTTKTDIDRIKKWPAKLLNDLYEKLKEGKDDSLNDGSYAVVIDADPGAQKGHLVQRINGRLEFKFSWSVTTGSGGLEEEPADDGEATQIGLLDVESVSKDFVVLGEDVSYEKKLTKGEHKFEIEGRNGLKVMYIAPLKHATVAVEAWYVKKGNGRANGRALHNGPIQDANAPSSHGCTRLPLDVVLILDKYIGLGSSVLIWGLSGVKRKGEEIAREKERTSPRSSGTRFNEGWQQRAFERP